MSQEKEKKRIIPNREYCNRCNKYSMTLKNEFKGIYHCYLCGYEKVVKYAKKGFAEKILEEIK